MYLFQMDQRPTEGSLSVWDIFLLPLVDVDHIARVQLKEDSARPGQLVAVFV